MSDPRGVSPALDLAGRIVAHDLTGCRPGPLPAEPLGSAAWRDLLVVVRRQRVEGPLAFAIEAGRCAATDEQREEAFAAHRAVMALDLLLERELVELTGPFAAAGVPMRVLKGPASAHLDELDPAWRAFGDLDLLVRASDLATVEELLTARGGRRRYGEPAPGFDRRFSKGLSFTFERNCEIDVHRTLASGAFGLTIDLDALFDRTTTFRLGRTELVALDRTGRCLHACYHAVLGGPEPRLNALRDLVHTAPADRTDLDELLARARAWRAEAVVALAVDTGCRHLGWTPPAGLHAWARGHRPTRRERWWLAAYVGPDRSYAAQMLVGLDAVPGLRDKVAYAWANASPAPGPGVVPGRWRRGARSLAKSLRR